MNNSLIPKTEYLLDNPADLAKFVLLHREVLNAVKAEIRAIDKLALAQEVRAQKKEEAQMLAEALLDTEVKLGEMMRQIPKASGRPPEKNDTDVENYQSKQRKSEVIESFGFSMKQAERLETLATNPDLVEQVKAEARENDDLPTRTQVLRLAKARQERSERANEDIDVGHRYYRHLVKAHKELPFISLDIRELKRLIAAFDPECLDEEIQDIGGCPADRGFIRSL